MIFRIHHSYGDGYSTQELALRIMFRDRFKEFFDENYKKLLKKFKKTRENDRISSFLKNFDKTFFINLLGWLKLPYFSYQKYFNSKNSFIYGSKNPGISVNWWELTEDESLIQKLKSLKSKIPESNFTTILLEAIGKSLQKRVNVKTGKTLEDYSVMIPFIGQSEFKNQDEVLWNRISAAHLENSNSKFNFYLLVSYFMLKLVCMLPGKLIEIIQIKTLFSFTNFFFDSEISFDNFKVEGVIALTPIANKSPIGFTTLTVNGKLRMGLTHVNSLVLSGSDWDEFEKDILTEIDEMCENHALKFN